MKCLVGILNLALCQILNRSCQLVIVELIGVVLSARTKPVAV